MKIGQRVRTFDGQEGEITVIKRIQQTGWITYFINDKWYVSWQVSLFCDKCGQLLPKTERIEVKE